MNSAIGEWGREGKGREGVWMDGLRSGACALL